MNSKNNSSRASFRTAAIYALASVAWILVSDRILAATVTAVETMTFVQTIKGWIFVLVTSGVIFFLMRQEMNRFFGAMEAQKASEANFRLLVENAPDAIFVQCRGQFAYVNAAALALFGASKPADLLEASMMDRFHPDFHGLIRDRMHQVNRERKPNAPVEQVYVRMDGSRLNVEVKSIPFEFNGENGALVFVRDITERKLAEEALRRFELLVENSRDIILFIRRDDGRILEANAAACTAYGYSRDELLTLTVQDLREPGTLGLLGDQMAKADAEGILFETIHRRKDGTRFPVEISSRGATIQGLRTLITIGRDITRRVESEQALRRSELNFRNLADSMPQLVWTATADGRFDYFNRRIEEFSGYERKADGKWEWSAAVHPDDSAATAEALGQAIDSGQANEIEHRLRQRDGSYKWFLSRAIPERGPEGRVVRWYGTSTDIDDQKKTQTALAESDARLRLSLDSARMGVWEHDLKADHITGDSALFELFGVHTDRFSGAGSDLQQMVDPRDRSAIRASAKNAIEHRAPYEVEFRITRPDGEMRWMRSQGRVIRGQADQPLRMLGVVWDITGIKSAQQQLQEATQRLDYLVTESPAVVYTYTLHPHLRLDYISRNLESILGWRPEQFTDTLQFWNECIHPADLPLIQDGLNRLNARGKNVFEYRFKDAQGKYRWIHDEQRVVHAGDGPTQVVGAWWDVTDTRMAQDELRRLAAAIDQAAEIVLITNERGDIVYVNPAFEKITGYSAQEVLGKNPRIFKSGEHDRAFYQNLWAMLSAGKPWHGLFINRKKDGRLYTEEATISPVIDASGTIVNYVAVKRDVTREQELEQQFLEAQKMEAIGTLAGGIAHDFNNILAVILANAEILGLSDGLTSESRDCLNQIVIASKRARQLVRQILAVSRRGKQDKIIMSLRPIVKETMGLLRASLPSTIRLEPQIAADTGMIFADPTQMQQVLMNLCTNAGHAMEEKGGSLKLSLSNTSILERDAPSNQELAPGEYVRIAVSDTGHGMPPWILKRIFEPYFTTKETGKGTGLGLSVAFGIVKSHGGTIRVSSVAGKGSIFEVYLPRVKGEAPAPELVEMPLLSGSGRILFVDDEPGLAQAAHKMLGILGYQVDTATSPVEALEVFRSDPTGYDLVITDLTMPDMTGTGLAKELLRMRPDVPVILCTGFSDQVNEEALESMGIDGLLVKPLTIHELALAVRRALVKR
ncbi:MAG: PAS domain S-box protein [Desulfobacterales bacterium]|jgi:PAS domain S-box-containing protein|nr:PAS domain S-box protein [Desulfobacterales bacterium]